MKQSNRAVDWRAGSSALQDLSARHSVAKSKAFPLRIPQGPSVGQQDQDPQYVLGTTGPTQPPRGAQSLAEALQWASGRRVSWDTTLISAGIKAPGREKYLTLQGSILQWGGYVPVPFPANFCFVKATGKYFLWLTKQWDLWIGKLRIKREEISLLIKKLNNSVEDQLLELIPPEFEWNNFYLK